MPFDSLVKSSVYCICCLVHSSAWSIFLAFSSVLLCLVQILGTLLCLVPFYMGHSLFGAFLSLVPFLVHSFVWCISYSGFLCLVYFLLYLSCDWQYLLALFGSLFFGVLFYVVSIPFLLTRRLWIKLVPFMCLVCLFLVSLAYPCLVSQSVFVWCPFLFVIFMVHLDFTYV